MWYYVRRSARRNVGFHQQASKDWASRFDCPSWFDIPSRSGIYGELTAILGMELGFLDPAFLGLQGHNKPVCRHPDDSRIKAQGERKSPVQQIRRGWSYNLVYPTTWRSQG